MAADEPVWRQILAGRAPTDDLVSAVVEDSAIVLGTEGVGLARQQLRSQVLGAGPLESLLADPEVTDVLVNGVAGVWADRGTGLRREPLAVGDEAQVRRLAVRLAGLAGKRLDDTSPFVDGLLPGGVRLHAILPPLVDGGPHLSLRVPRRVTPTLQQLHDWGSCDATMLEALQALVRRRIGFVVSGGTGSGKTTVLGALLGEVPRDERLVIVEDVRELAVDHPHVVRLQGRSPNVEGRGSITLTALVRQSLRMRPDRLVVGEVRGAEVRELLTALNTGHEGGCGTVHANAPADVVARFEALGALAGMGPAAVHAQLLSALEVVVHLSRSGPVRVVEELAVVVSEGARPRVLPALSRGPDGSSGRREGWPRLAEMLALEEQPEPATGPDAPTRRPATAPPS
ncbi:TadA family conjugal transfer-associated ATPase [Segeticoccus rhizosphaerae]|jgi:pilus assembly protein CpaF|uniref:TadA family conjugal transfer-associated ATPase n=1 Tax=Segeticoccus rhizosphaerae TaxID=1104777 RepID=UPI0010BFADF3|nr:TadA family conjugal transfer-associated ATPase [Ornithinicoccus soli]